MWITAKELVGIAGLPTSPQGVNKKAKKENWQFRKVEGVQGKGKEYLISSLPEEVQAAILLKTAKETAPAVIEKKEVVEQERYLSASLWQNWDKATEKQKETAKTRMQAVQVLAGLLKNKMPFLPALELSHKQTGQAQGSIKNWYYKAKNFNETDWLVALLPNYRERIGKRADFTEDAWEFFKADYFRPERPEFGSCYQRLLVAASENDWNVPSVSSVKRKIEREIDKKLQVLWREGDRALADMYPTLIRSVEDVEAMEWINGDGYQHNVFVEWMNGEVVRPKTWLWQDVRTRKILAYRTDLSENSDTIRLSLMDVVSRYGIPKKLTIDNTRAAANKWMTGGVKNRYRFKVKEDDPMGIIPLLGIQLYWTSVQFGKGHGQAKPIERAFSHGGLGETVDKHPKLASFYAGANVYDKPDNYNGGKKGAPYEDFILALEDGIRLFNERQNRKTEICQGVYSFAQVFQRDYAKATVTKATREQIRMMMLMSEAVTLKQNGTFSLDAGGKIAGRKNRYQALELVGKGYKKVVVKFDPQKLHEEVEVYSLDGIFLCKAICSEKVAFGDKATGREHDKARKQWVKAHKAVAKAEKAMSIAEASQFMPEVEIDDEIQKPNISEMFFPDGNAVKKAQVVAEQELDDEESEFERFFQKGVELMKNK